MINQIRNRCVEQKMQYIPFGYPLEYDKETGTWATTANVEKGNKLEIVKTYGLTFAPSGISYLLYRLSSFMDKVETAIFKREARELLTKSMQEFTDFINDTRTEQFYAEPKRQDETLIAAVNEGKIYGIMTTYNPVSNEQVLDLVESQNMQDRVTGYKLTMKEMNLFLRTGFDGPFQWGMNIRNGETGHVTFGYHVYIQYHDYVFTFPLKERVLPAHNVRRHMSRVGEVSDSLVEIFESIQELDLWRFIVSQNAKNYAVQLSSEEKLNPYLESFTSGKFNVKQLLNMLLNLALTRGYKVVCTNSADKILKEVTEEFYTKYYPSAK